MIAYITTLYFTIWGASIVVENVAVITFFTKIYLEIATRHPLTYTTYWSHCSVQATKTKIRISHIAIKTISIVTCNYIWYNIVIAFLRSSEYIWALTLITIRLIAFYAIWIKIRARCTIETIVPKISYIISYTTRSTLSSITIIPIIISISIIASLTCNRSIKTFFNDSIWKFYKSLT